MSSSEAASCWPTDSLPANFPARHCRWASSCQGKGPLKNLSTQENHLFRSGEPDPPARGQVNIRSIVGSSDVRPPFPCLSRLLESVGQLQDSQVVLMPADDLDSDRQTVI